MTAPRCGPGGGRNSSRWAATAWCSAPVPDAVARPIWSGDLPSRRGCPPLRGPAPDRFPRMTPRDTVPALADPAPPPATMTPAELRTAFFRSFPGIAPAIVIAAIDQTIVATALPAIAGSLGAVERISWVVVAWLIAATVAAPVFGRLGDAHGR